MLNLDRGVVYAAIIIIILINGGLLYTTYKFSKELSDNPLIYVLKKHNLNSCVCSSNTGEQIYFNETTIVKSKYGLNAIGGS